MGFLTNYLIKWGVGTGAVIITALISGGHNYYYKSKTIYNTLKKGTTMETKPGGFISRETAQKRIRDLIDADDGMYGVVVGPAGTGKTGLTRLACCEPHTPGVLYHEISDAASFPQDLAKTIGMRFKSSIGILDLVIRKILSQEYESYYTLPNDQNQALHYVLDTLAEVSKQFKKKEGHVPCLVIDGVDLVAKKNEKAFTELIDQTKFYVNKRALYLVLVSSEGHIMPLINETSSRTRMAKVVQILDICDDDAIKYLTTQSMSEELSKSVVEYVGGRFVYLIKALEMKTLYLNLGHDQDELFDKIASELHRRYVRPGVLKMYEHIDEAKVIISSLLAEPEIFDTNLSFQPCQTIDPQKLYRGLTGENLKKMKETIKCLVDENLLRYDANGNLTWHSRLVRHALTSEYQRLVQE